MASSRALVAAMVFVAVAAMTMSLAMAQQDVVTVAGGLDDILSRAATFGPSSITLSPNGDLLFTETNANRIRWIPKYTTTPSAQAVVQTLVGTAQGNTVGKVNVLLNFPSGLVRDDSSITQLRTRYWFYNQGNAGDQLRILDVDYANEPFVTAVPTATTRIQAIAPDRSGNVIVAFNNGAMAVVTPAGVSSAFPNPGATVAQLINSAAGLFALDSSNRLYQFNSVMSSWGLLTTISPNSLLLTDGNFAFYLTPATLPTYNLVSLPTLAGAGSVSFPPTQGKLVAAYRQPVGGAVLAGFQPSLTSYGSLVSGTTTIIGGVPPRTSPGPLPGLQSRISSPQSIQVDPNTGKVLLGGIGALDLFDPTTNTVSNVFGTYSSPSSGFTDGPLTVATTRIISGIAAHPNNLAYYFLDYDYFGTTTGGVSLRVLRLNNPGDFSSGNVTTILNDAALTINTNVAYIYGLALDRPSKSLFFADANNAIVYRYYLETGVLSIIAGTVGTLGDVDGVGTQAQFAGLGGIAVSPVTGFVYVVDTYKVKQINPDTGYVLSFAGDGSPGQINGIGTAAEFQSPFGISVSSTGVIYVADSTRIRAINETTAEVTTAAGSSTGELDDLALRAQLAVNFYVAVDNFRGGNVVFFTDNNINSLRRLVAKDVCATTVCNDGNHCTTDVCVSALQGCVFTPNTLACDDGIECTGNDVCSNGVCAGGTALPLGSQCFNGNLCIINQHCIANATCTGDALVCNDENLCTIDTCDPARGCVFTQVNCDDSNPCTRDKCVSNIGCVHEPTSGAACDLDNNPCTLDVCSAAGVCTFTGPNPCDDGNPCTVDSCAASAGCLHADPSPCIGQNFQRDPLSCACECNINQAGQGCPVPADSLQCLCLVPNSGPFLRLEVHFNSTFGDRGQFSTDAQRDVYLRNQMAYYTLVNEASLVIVLGDYNGINGSRRLVMDVYGETTSNGQPLGVADILSRFAAASQCNFLPPACAPVSNSIFGSIEIFLLNPFQSAAPLAVPVPFQSLPPYVDNHIIHDVVEFPSESEGHYQISIPIYSAHNGSSRPMMTTMTIAMLVSAVLSIVMSMMS